MTGTDNGTFHNVPFREWLMIEHPGATEFYDPTRDRPTRVSDINGYARMWV